MPIRRFDHLLIALGVVADRFPRSWSICHFLWTMDVFVWPHYVCFLAPRLTHDIAMDTTCTCTTTLGSKVKALSRSFTGIYTSVWVVLRNIITWIDPDSWMLYVLVYWRLDIGDGKEVNLEKCPRSKLQGQCIQYLGPVTILLIRILGMSCKN